MLPNKPRESILFLFDPLATPATPPRNTNSPDSASSDKENGGASVQPGQLTAFFNRVYKEEPTQDVKLAKGRLIDFGDSSFASGGDEETRDDEVVDENANIEMSPSTRRRPLADLEVERIASPTSPIPKEPQYVPTLSRVSWTESTTLSPFIAPSSPCSGPEPTLADVINEINLSTMSISDKQELREESSVPSCPNITVCPPDAEVAPSSPRVASDTTQPFSPLHLSPVASATTSGPTRRGHTSSNTSSNDPRRTSVDLQSSFNLHMQSTEMSFDLLNDKISFLNSSPSNYILADADMSDDTFDMAKEQLKMEEIASRYMEPRAINIDEDTFDLVKEQQRMETVLKRYMPIHEESLDEVVRDIPRVKELTPPKPAPTIEHTLESATKPVARPPVFSLPSASDGKSSEEPQDEPTSGTSTDPLSPTSSGPKTAPAPALTKKTWKLQRSQTVFAASSASSESSSTLPTSMSQSRSASNAGSSSDVARPSLPTKAPARRLSSALSTVKPVLRAPTRLPSTSVPAVPAIPPVKPAAASRTLATGSATSGPKRTIPSDSSVSAKPPVGSKGSSGPASSRLYRPVLPSASRRESITTGSTQPRLALRPPTTAASTTTATPGAKSALPRPASRLPAPSKFSSSVARRL